MDYLQELKFINKRQPRSKDALYLGLEITVDEFTRFVGGPAKFKNIINQLQTILKNQIKKEEGVELDKFEYSDYAIVSWANKPGEIYLHYTIWAVDKTNHMMTAAYILRFKNGKEDADIISGWDG